MANPNVEAAYFWVQIGQNKTNKKYKVKGSDFPNVAKGPEMVWVQRGEDHYWTWYGQPKDPDSPDLSYRFNYFIQNHDQSNNQRSQPNQDGQINFSLFFEAPGPYPTNEWRNIRNDKAGGSIQDLDGKTLVLKNNTEIENGDICRITHSGGMENWYIFDSPDGNNFIKFKALYTKGGDGNDADRPRVDVKRTGSRPSPDGTQEVVLSIYKKANLKPFERIANTDWVWAQGKDENNDWQHYKVSGENFKELFFVEPEPDPSVLSLTCSKAEIFAGQSFNICWEAQDGDSYRLRAGHNNLSYAISEEGCYNYTVTAPGTYTYTVQVISSGNVVLASDSIQVVIKPTPITISVDNSTQFCGTNIRFTWFIDGDKRPVQSQFHGFYSNARPFTNNVGPDGGKTVTVTTPGSYNYTYEAQDSNRNVMGSETLRINWISPPTASISSSKTQAGENEIFRISWTASGGTSYKLYDSQDGSRYTVSSNSSKEFSASRYKSTRSFYIEVYDTNGTKVASESVNVAQLGRGNKWSYSSTIAHGGEGKWGSGAEKTKFHNTDASGTDQRTWWSNFAAGTRKVKIDGSYYEVPMPSIGNVGTSAGGISSFNMKIAWPFTYPPSSGSIIEIFDLPD